DRNGADMEMHPRPVDVEVKRPIGEGYGGKDSQLDKAGELLFRQIGGPSVRESFAGAGALTPLRGPAFGLARPSFQARSANRVDRPMLVILSGLPATGKPTTA